MTESFKIKNGVKKIRNLTLVFLSTFFTYMLSYAKKNRLEEAIYVQYHLDISVFDFRRYCAKTKFLQHLTQEDHLAGDWTVTRNPNYSWDFIDSKRL